jgi:hypothetical protein
MRRPVQLERRPGRPPALVVHDLDADHVLQRRGKAHGEQRQVDGIRPPPQRFRRGVNRQGRGLALSLNLSLNLNLMRLHREMRRDAGAHVPITVGEFHG